MYCPVCPVSICLFCLSVCLSVCLRCLSVHTVCPHYLSVCLSTLPVRTVCLHCLFTLSVCLSVCLCLHTVMYSFLPTHLIPFSNVSQKQYNSVPHDRHENSVLFSLNGLIEGTTQIVFNATVSPDQTITSDPATIQVFSELRVEPEEVILIPTATFQVCLVLTTVRLSLISNFYFLFARFW